MGCITPGMISASQLAKIHWELLSPCFPAKVYWCLRNHKPQQTPLPLLLSGILSQWGLMHPLSGAECIDCIFASVICSYFSTKMSNVFSEFLGAWTHLLLDHLFDACIWKCSNISIPSVSAKADTHLLLNGKYNECIDLCLYLHNLELRSHRSFEVQSQDLQRLHFAEICSGSVE